MAEIKPSEKVVQEALENLERTILQKVLLRNSAKRAVTAMQNALPYLERDKRGGFREVIAGLQKAINLSKDKREQ